MDEMKQILAYAQAHNEEFLETLRGAVEIESPTYGAKSNCDRCSEYFQHLFASLGMKITVYPQQEVGNHFTAETEGTGKPLLILGHFDTVFPVGTLETMPFRVDGNKLRGPGVYDMKGGMVAAYYALRALKELNLMPERKIILCANSDEEPGSFTSQDIFVPLARESRAVLVLEPGLDTVGSVKTIRKGRGWYTLTAHGKSAHTGHNPDKAASPLLELAHQLPVIQGMSDFANGISVMPVYVQGGVEGACMVPETATMVIDTRYPTVEEGAVIDRQLHALQPVVPGCTLELTGGALKHPLMFTEQNQKVFQLADSIAQELGFKLEGRMVGGGSDGNYVATTGVPVLDGYGMVGANLHTPDEFLYIDCIPQRVALTAGLMRRL